MPPDLDHWLPRPSLRVSHYRPSTADPARLWEAARAVRLGDTRLLGRLVRWRIPGVPAGMTYDEMFRNPPFSVLFDEDGSLLCGIVGRIWTLRRDYPVLANAEQFRQWSERGTARVLFGNWVESASDAGATLHAEARVQVFGVQGRLGLRAVRPLITAFQHLVGTDGIEAAVRVAEGNARSLSPRHRR